MSFSKQVAPVRAGIAPRRVTGIGTATLFAGLTGSALFIGDSMIASATSFYRGRRTLMVNPTSALRGGMMTSISRSRG
jgi:hypothetical protein